MKKIYFLVVRGSSTAYLLAPLFVLLDCFALNFLFCCCFYLMLLYFFLIPIFFINIRNNCRLFVFQTNSLYLKLLSVRNKLSFQWYLCFEIKFSNSILFLKWFSFNFFFCVRCFGFEKKNKKKKICAGAFKWKFQVHGENILFQSWKIYFRNSSTFHGKIRRRSCIDGPHINK